MRRGSIAAAVTAVVLAIACGVASAQGDAIVGTWRGTSTCVDHEHYPACTDEQVIYEVRARSGSRDTVTVRADKLVNGARELIDQRDFTRQGDDAWAAEIRTPRVQLRVTLRIVADRMTGTLTDLAADRRVREMALGRVR